MKSRAAVLHGVGMDWEVTEVDLDPPHAGRGAGQDGLRRCLPFRRALLHRRQRAQQRHGGPDAGVRRAGTGMVPDARRPRRVAEWWKKSVQGVKTLKPGDHVAISFLPACGSCRWCATGHTYLCDIGADIYSKNMTTDGTMTPPSRRRGPDGDDAGRHFLRVRRRFGAFAGQSARLDTPGGGIARFLRCDNRIRIRLGRRRHEGRRHRRGHRRRWHRHERGPGREGGGRQIRRRRRSCRIQTPDRPDFRRHAHRPRRRSGHRIWSRRSPGA